MNKTFKKITSILLITILSLSILAGCSGDKDGESEKETSKEAKEGEEVELIVSAAASLTDVMEDIKELYEAENENVNLSFTFGGSGALQAQIEEGAPVDVFISAAEKQMDALEETGHILEDTRKSLLINNVVLIKPLEEKLEVKGFEDLGNDNISKIAIGDPSNVPVGQYSEEIFDNLDLRDKIKDKLILAEDVRTVLSWVEMGEVDLGIVYETDAFTSDKVEIISKAPESSHKTVSYPVSVIKDSLNSEAAKDFINFLSEEKVSKLFESYGFEVNDA